MEDNETASSRFFSVIFYSSIEVLKSCGEDTANGQGWLRIVKNSWRKTGQMLIE